MAYHLANYEKRKKWFLNIINEYVESANRERPEHKRHKWRMKESHFVEMLTRIFVEDIKSMKPKASLKAAMKKHHGDEGIERMGKMMQALKADVKSKLSKNRAMS